MISRPDLKSYASDIPTLLYPEQELEALKQLESLFVDWHQGFAKDIKSIQDHGSFYDADSMVCDGFYPHYFSQKPRVLFVGKESIGMSGQHYIQSLHHTYKTIQRLGRGGNKASIHLNRSKFHSRLLKLTYALTKGLPAWRDIPHATEIGRTFGTVQGVSCAFMNLSKFSTERAHWAANWPLIMASNRISEAESFSSREITILQPDIVIAMNLGPGLSLLGRIEKIDAGKVATTYRLNSNGHSSLLIETFHFSARKNDLNDYYLPICESIQKHLLGRV
jgi:hypothetical protein